MGGCIIERLSLTVGMFVFQGNLLMVRLQMDAKPSEGEKDG